MVVHYIGFSEVTGYGTTAGILIEALKKNGVNVVYTGVREGNSDRGGVVVRQEGDLAMAADAVIIHTLPEYFPYWYTREKERNPNAKIWGYTTWETDKPPVYWAPLLNLMDALFVPCQMNKAVFEKAGVERPIYLLPHISQFEGKASLKSSKSLTPVFDSLAGRFIFYYIGTWTERKVPWLVIEAFNQEFSSAENVALVVKTGIRDWVRYRRSWKTLFRKGISYSADSFKKYNRRSKNRVIHIDKELDKEEIAMIHDKSHCFISLTRGEGWGVPSFEAAWFGRPVIITGFGGMLDYLNPENAYLVDYKLVPVEVSLYPDVFSRDQRWADPDLAHARKLMRHIFNHQEEARFRGGNLQQAVMKTFGSDSIAAQCIDSLTKEAVS